MSFSRLLLDISPGSPRRHAAWQEFYTELEKLGREGFILPKSGRVLRIPEQDLPDIVNAVALKVLERGPLKVTGKGEGECRRYLTAMLRNRWLDEQRKRQRRREDSLEEIPQADLEEATATPEQLFSLPDARKLLDRVFQALHEERAPRYRPELLRAWKQLCLLTFDGVSMDELLRDDEGVTDTTSVAERKSAQQRIHQNHSRLRKSLALTVDTLCQRGTLPPTDAELAHRLIGELSRCQKLTTVRISLNEA